MRDLEVAERRIGAEAAAVFELDPETPATTITRTILADGDPVAVMRDVLRPGLAGPARAELERAVEAGAMVLDALIAAGVPVAFAVTRVRPRMVSSREKLGRALGVSGATAVLELEEVMRLASGEAIQHSTDVFAPDGIDLQVRRDLEVSLPAPLVRAVGR